MLDLCLFDCTTAYLELESSSIWMTHCIFREDLFKEIMWKRQLFKQVFGKGIDQIPCKKQIRSDALTLKSLWLTDNSGNKISFDQSWLRPLI